MSSHPVMHVYMLILAWLSLTCSTGQTPSLKCDRSVQVLCSINGTEPVMDDYRWKPAVCMYTSSKEIGFMFSKPPENLEGLEKFEIRLFMNRNLAHEMIIPNANIQTKCRYKNLEPAEYEIRIRPINPSICVCKDGGRCKRCVTRTVKIELTAFEVPTIVTNNTTDTEIKLPSGIPTVTADHRTYHMTPTVTDNHMTPTVTDDRNTNHMTPTVTADLSTNHVTPTVTDYRSTAHVAPTDQYNDTTVLLESTDPHQDPLYHAELEDIWFGWKGSLVLVLVIVMMTLACLGCKRMSVSQRKGFEPCSTLITNNLCRTREMSSQQTACQDKYNTVSWTKSQDVDHQAYDSGFDSNNDRRENNASTDIGHVLKAGEYSINNSLCDISDGAFVANSLVWADMDRDLSASVCTIASTHSDNKRRQTSSKRVNCVRYHNAANITEGSHIAPGEQDMMDYQISCKSERVRQDKDYSYTGQHKYSLPALFGRIYPLKSKDFRSDTEMPEQARMLGPVVIDENDKYPMFIPPSFIHSAETLNISGEMGWVNSDYVKRLRGTHDDNTHGTFKATKQPAFTCNDDINDIISLGAISI